MLAFYEKKHNLISQFYILTQDIEKILDEAEDITQENVMEQIMELINKRGEIVSQVDEIDKQIFSEKKSSSDAKRIQNIKASMEIMLSKSILIEKGNQDKIEKLMKEISGNLKELKDEQKQIEAYIPIDEASSVHIDISQ